MKEMTETREVESFGGLRVKKFGMKVNAKAFRTVIKNLYSRVIPSACRELGSNAFDSHIKAGKPNLPFEVRLPTKFDPTFAVRDYGVGLTIDEIENIYTVMFESTKDQSNDEVGKFGLGAKIPFAYGDIFGLTSWKNGRKLIYSMMLDENSEPCAALLSDEPSNEPTGVEVSFPVAEKDWEAFTNGAIRSFAAFPVMPEINNATITNSIRTLHESGRKVNSGVIYVRKDFAKVYGDGAEPIWVRQGCVIYPIRAESYTPEMKTVASILQSSSKVIVVDVPIGDVEVTPNREEVIYDDRTVANISKRMTGGAREITADNLRLIARATLKSRWNIIDLYQARMKSFDMKIMGSNVGDPYPHLKVFGQPVCFWQSLSQKRLRQYAKRVQKNRGVQFYCMSMHGVSDHDTMSDEELVVRQKVSISEMNNFSFSSLLFDNYARQHKRPDKSYYGVNQDFKSKPLSIIILDEDIKSRTDREIGLTVIKKFIEMGEKEPREKAMRSLVIRGGTEKDVMMLWHFLGRSKHKPEILKLKQEDIPHARSEAIKTVVTYNSGSSRGVEVKKLINADAFFVMIACEKGEKTLFGQEIRFDVNQEKLLRKVIQRSGIEGCDKRAIILLVPPSKMKMTKEAFGDKLSSAEEVLIKMYGNINPDDYDLCQFYTEWSSHKNRKVKYRGEDLNPSDRLWVHLAISGISETEIIGVNARHLSIPAKDALRRLGKAACDISILRKFMDCRGYESPWEKDGFSLRPEKILEDADRVKWLKDNKLYSEMARIDRHIAKADWRKSKLAKSMLSVRKILHKKSPLLAAMFEHGHSPYLQKTLGGYSYVDCVKDDIDEALEKARLYF